MNTRSGRCVPGVCKNGGRCVDLLVGGFLCQCPDGEYEKPYCEMTTRSFPGQSFVTFRGLRQRFHFTLSFMSVNPLELRHLSLHPPIHPCTYLTRQHCLLADGYHYFLLLLNTIKIKISDNK